MFDIENKDNNDTSKDGAYYFRAELDPATKQILDKVSQTLCQQLGLPVRRATAFRILLNRAARDLNITGAAA